VPFHASGRVICSTLPDFSADRKTRIRVTRLPSPRLIPLSGLRHYVQR
jgi:hypothetical protein